MKRGSLSIRNAIIRTSEDVLWLGSTIYAWHVEDMRGI